MGDVAESASLLTHYDAHYAAGGFGYDARRSQWTLWAWKHYVREFQLTAPLPLPGRRPTLLDIPCGDGFWTSVMTRLGLDSQGIDLSLSGVAEARRHYPRLTFQVGNAEEDLPVDEGAFDVVFSRAISHLHRQDLTAPATVRMATNLMRYVAKDGQLLVSYYTKRYGGGPAQHHHHPVSDLVRLCEQAGDVWRVDVVGDFVQIGVRHRGAAPVYSWTERAARKASRLRRGERDPA